MISFKNVCFNYNSEDKTDKDTLSEINISISRGELIVVTGESGCGKTTIGRLINGLSPKFYNGDLSGSIKVSSIDPSKSELYETAKVVGSIFQNPRTQFFNVDTTSEITFSCENAGMARDEILKRLDYAVKELNIEKLLNRSIFDLSGGEKQKIACACVATADTEVIVMDEPSSNLDIKSIEDLKKIIGKWKEKGKTIIIAEHRLYYLKELADKLIIMKNGRIHRVIEAGDIEKLSMERLNEAGLRTLSMKELFKSHLPVRNRDTTTIRHTYHIDNMSFNYGRGKNGICIDNLDLSSGEITALIGMNGAGKSTFAKCLTGINKKCKDHITHDDKRIKCRERIEKSFLVMQDVNTQLFADSVLNEVMISLREKYGRGFKSEDHMAEALKILEMMDLIDLKDRHPISLSGGQKQRVAIAGAIAADKEIIILDEPTSGLDYKHMQEVANVLKKLADMGKTLIVITHDLEFILLCAGRVICMDKGRIIEEYKLGEDTKDKLYNFFEISISD